MRWGFLIFLLLIGNSTALADQDCGSFGKVPKRDVDTWVSPMYKPESFNRLPALTQGVQIQGWSLFSCSQALQIDAERAKAYRIISCDYSHTSEAASYLPLSDFVQEIKYPDGTSFGISMAEVRDLSSAQLSDFICRSNAVWEEPKVSVYPQRTTKWHNGMPLPRMVSPPMDGGGFMGLLDNGDQKVYDYLYKSTPATDALRSLVDDFRDEEPTRDNQWTTPAPKRATRLSAADFAEGLKIILRGYQERPDWSAVSLPPGDVVVDVAYQDGRVVDSSIVKSSGDAQVDAFARKSVQDFSNHPVAVPLQFLGQMIMVQVTYDFAPDWQQGFRYGFTGKTAPQNTTELAALMGAVAQRNLEFPRDALMQGNHGDVVVAFDYLDGKALDVKITHSSGRDDLDKAALHAVETASYPAYPAFAGKRVHVERTIHIDIDWLR